MKHTKILWIIICHQSHAPIPVSVRKPTPIQQFLRNRVNYTSNLFAACDLTN